jgi:toxin HigB-1
LEELKTSIAVALVGALRPNRVGAFRPNRAAFAAKQLGKSPLQVQQKMLFWAGSVQAKGLLEVRKQPGWHDEPLKGTRKGQRSIRLNKQWRAIYVLRSNGTIEFCEVKEVTPHDY